MSNLLSFLKSLRGFFLLTILLLGLFSPVQKAIAKTPPEMRSPEDLEISMDMHGRILNGEEFVKVDLRGVDLSESDLRGAVFNISRLQGTNLRGADMEDVVAFASDFEGADLRDVNLTNALLMESRFEDASIEGADFTNAVLSKPQQKMLCQRANGTNPTSGESTSQSLGC